jgi:5'-nucleotidase
MMNVNVPDVSINEIAGFENTHLGHRHKVGPVLRMTDPRGRIIYWLGQAAAEQDVGPGTEFYAVSHGYVSVTLMQVNLRLYAALDILGDWLQGCEV